MIRLWVDYVLAADVGEDDTQIILRDTTDLASGGGKIRIGGEIMIYSSITAAATTEDPNRGILSITDRGVDFTPILDHKAGVSAWYLVPSTAYVGITWPGRRMHFDAIVSRNDISFWPPTTAVWELNDVDQADGTFIALPDGTYLIDGITLVPVSGNVSVDLRLGTSDCADVAELAIGLLVGDFCSMYVDDDGFENGEDFDDTFVPDTPVAASVGNVKTITIDLDAGGGLLDWTQYIALKAYCSDTLITKVSIDWDDGGGAEDFLLDGTSLDEGLGGFPSRQIDARFSHDYSADATYTINIELHDAGGVVDTRDIEVTVARTADYAVDQIQIQRRRGSAGDTPYMHESDTVHDWISPPANNEISDPFTDPFAFQYRLRVRRFTIDGRSRPGGPVEVTSLFSDWSAAV